MSFGAFRVGYVDAKLSVKPCVKREVNGETVAIRDADVVLLIVHI